MSLIARPRESVVLPAYRSGKIAWESDVAFLPCPGNPGFTTVRRELAADFRQRLMRRFCNQYMVKGLTPKVGT